MTTKVTVRKLSKKEVKAIKAKARTVRFEDFREAFATSNCDDVLRILPPQTKLITGKEARITSKQHTQPCSDCPWSRTSLPGWLGAYSAEQWLAMAHGEATVECHALKNLNSAHQCAGFAIFRANICKSPRDPDAFRLPQNKKAVFSWDNEFLNHHNKENP